MGTQITMIKKPEDVSNESDDSDTDDDMPEMEDGEVEGSGKPKQSRSEKKSRKAMAKLGMKPVPGIIRVTVKKSKNILFVIKEPDVFKTGEGGGKQASTYVVFGKAEIEDLSAQANAAAVEQFKAAQPGAEALTEKIEEVSAEGDDDDEDAGDLDENEIELVVKQAG